MQPSLERTRTSHVSTRTATTSSTSPIVLTSSSPSTSSGELLSPAAVSTTPSSTPSHSTRLSSNYVNINVGVGIGVLAGLALCAGLAYLIRRRLKTRSGRDWIQAYLDDKRELHASQKILHENCELAWDSRPQELSGQGLMELQCLHEHLAVEGD